jgi:hypothetical protein
MNFFCEYHGKNKLDSHFSQVKSIHEKHESGSEIPIMNTDELIQVLKNGFNRLEKHTTNESDGNKHQVILMELKPMDGEMNIPSLKFDHLTHAHCFEFQKNNVTIKAHSSASIGETKPTTIRDSKTVRNPALAIPLQKSEYDKAITNQAKQKTMSFLNLNSLIATSKPNPAS